MEPRRSPLRNLAGKLHSLLGLKTQLTSNWASSVCDIIKTIPTQASDDNNGDPCSKLRGELAALDNRASQLHAERRQVLNDFLDLKGNIRVFCRVRPYIAGESNGYSRPVLAVDASNILLKVAGSSKSKNYTFDKVFSPASSQEEVFSEVEPLIRSVIDGYNACIFAYGQTGTGKTFTMEGQRDAPGLVPRAMEALFQQARGSSHALYISFSMFEIYMGNLRDLLIPKPTKATDPFPPCLSIQSNKKGEVEIEKLVAIQVNDLNQAMRLYRLGCRLRSTASTNSNSTSSRSHCMIRLQVSCLGATGRRRETNKMWLVDLGGSERVLKTKASGRRLDEGKAINLSLSALGDVIYSLQRNRRHVPYRNSKLTQVLKDSLGDDSKALMLVHVSPKEDDICETICSLNFAARVKSIHLRQDITLEMKQQKETAIAYLRQKLEKIEGEQLQIGRESERINKEIEKLTGNAICSKEQPDYLWAEEPVTKNIAASTSAPSSKMPRFMRPTICSQGKSAATNQTVEQTEPVNARRRRPSSHRAESVTLPSKNHFDYNSDCSISRYSCLAGLNVKSNSIDQTSECSQGTNDIESVLAAATLQRKNSQRSCTRADEQLEKSNMITRDSRASGRDFVNEIRAMEVQALAFQMATDKPVTTLKDLFHDESKCNSVSSSSSETMTKSHCSLDFSSVEDEEVGTPSSSSSHDDFSVGHSSCHSDNDSMHVRGKAHGIVSESEPTCWTQQEVIVCREVTTMHHHHHHHPVEPRSRRALFPDAAVVSEDSTKVFDHIPIVEPQPTRGRSLISSIWENTEVLCASAVAGLGFYGLGGLDHDFFFGLTL